MKRRKIDYDPQNDYYKRLGVPPTASQSDIQQAYRRKAKKLHPDVNPARREWATDQFQLLREAYDVLSDAELRQMYDARRQVKTGQRDWWDIPHAPQPGYVGVRSRPPHPYSRPRRVARGVWLQERGLGFLRPFYAPLAELAFSPYRYVLGLLTVVLVGNLLFIVFGIALQQESPSIASSPEAALPTSNAAQGVVATQPPTNAPSEMIVLESPCIAELVIVRVEQLPQSVKITAWVALEGLRTSRVRIVRIQSVDETTVRRVEAWRDADLVLQPDPPTQADVVIGGSGLPAGLYLVGWTPVLPDGTIPGACHQVIQVTG